MVEQEMVVKMYINAVIDDFKITINMKRKMLYKWVFFNQFQEKNYDALMLLINFNVKQ